MGTMMGVKRLPCFLALLAVAACATGRAAGPYVGKPVAEAVALLGPPVSVADYQGKGRFFTFSRSDAQVVMEGAEDPANWTQPATRLTASPPAIGDERYQALPPLIASRSYRPDACTLTLVAEWDEDRRAWVAKRVIPRGAPPSGRCGPGMAEER